MPRGGQQSDIELGAWQHQALLHAAKGMLLPVRRSWLELGFPSLQLWARMSLQVQSILQAAHPVVSWLKAMSLHQRCPTHFPSVNFVCMKDVLFCPQPD